MESEPPKADLSKRKRHWFQFSVRTLLIVVAAFCVLAYFGSQLKKVGERKALLIQQLENDRQPLNHPAK
jgi:hypothetical protein